MLPIHGITLYGGGYLWSNISARIPRIRGIDCTLQFKCLYSRAALNLLYIDIKGETMWATVKSGLVYFLEPPSFLLPNKIIFFV